MAKKRPQETARPAAVPATDWRRHGLVALGLAALVLAAYFNCFRSGFLFDNKPIILDDPRVHAATSQNIDEIWSKGYWYRNQDPTLYRPLTTLTYLWNYAVFGNGTNPAGYHAVNVLLHWLNVLLVYALGLVLFRQGPPAIALAALWGVHPVLTESVTNIVGRADLLSAFGVLGGILCHVYGARSGGRKPLWLAGLAVAAAIGIFSKESSVVLIALLLVYDLTFRREQIRTCVPGYAAVALPLAAFFYMRWQVLQTLPGSTTLFVMNPLVGAGFWISRLTAIQIIGRYLGLLAWPATLSCDYSYNQIPLFQGTFHNAADWATVGALAVCIASAGLAVQWFRRNKPGFFCIALFFVALAPVANIAMLIGTIMAERLLYFPAIGFMGSVVWAVNSVVDRRAVRLLAITGMVCLAFVARTHMRNSDWENGASLWASAVASSPHSYKAHQNLAVEFFPENVDRSVVQDQRSLDILAGLAPGQQDPIAFVDAGAHQRAKGDLDKRNGAEDQARAWYRRSLGSLLRAVEVQGAVTAQIEQTSRAAGKVPAALPGAYLAYQELGQTYLRLGEARKAIDAVEDGLAHEITPDFLKILSDAQAAQGDKDQAAIALMEGIVIYPDQKGFPSELLKLYQDWSTASCAVQTNAAGANLNLECPLVHNHLCAAMGKAQALYVRRGQTGEAEKVRAGAVQGLGCPAQ